MAITFDGACLKRDIHVADYIEDEFLWIFFESGFSCQKKPIFFRLVHCADASEKELSSQKSHLDISASRICCRERVFAVCASIYATSKYVPAPFVEAALIIQLVVRSPDSLRYRLSDF